LMERPDVALHVVSDVSNVQRVHGLS
jgi:hypothetical protein